MKILIIEGENHPQYSASQLLAAGAAPDIHAHAEPSLFQGLKVLRKDFFDLVLLDLSLPGVVGVEAIRKIQGICPKVPVVVLNGLSEIDSAVEAIKNGAADYIVKTQLSGEVLNRTVRFALERCQTQHRLNESLTLYSELFHRSNDAIFIHDRDGRILQSNSKACELFGRSEEEFSACNMRDLNPIENQADLERVLEQLQKEGSVRFEIPYRKKSGEVLFCEVSASLINLNGRDVVQAIVRDVSARKKLMQQLKNTTEWVQRKRSQLTEALETKSKFTSMVSHELRTPLTSIREGIAIVLDGSAGELNVTQKDFLGVAKRNVDRLYRLINDVLNYAKLESGKMQFNRAPVDLGLLAHSVVEDQLMVAHKQGLYINADIEPGLPELNLDADKIVQVLVNLINNSVKFTPSGGITIKVEQTKKDAANPYVVVRVKDTGIGIKKEDLTKLFERFQQVGNDNYRSPGSSGLGLAISREIVEGHGGEIWAESEYGKGSEFIFILPSVGNVNAHREQNSFN